MHKKQTLTVAGIGALGAAALLLSGCGGSSFQKNTFGSYPETLPAAFGIEPVAASGNLQLTPQFYETSGIGTVDGKTAYLTAATDFSAPTAKGASLNINVDPNGTGKVPLGFPIDGFYIDAANGNPDPSVVVQPGASVVFRAALANGVSGGNAIEISTVSLSSTDPQWSLGTLPLIFNNPGAGGPLANGTYVTGTGGTPAPFALPFTSSGIHTVAATVTDAAGRVADTTFAIPVVKASDVALFLQNFTVAVPATATKAASTTPSAITPGDKVTIDGGPGIGTYPATGYNADTGKPSMPTTADAQGTVVLFTTPGTHTLTETDDTGAVVQTSTFTLAADTAGTTIYDAPVTTAAATATIVRHRAAARH